MPTGHELDEDIPIKIIKELGSAYPTLYKLNLAALEKHQFN
jgi:hypothetical protein